MEIAVAATTETDSQSILDVYATIKDRLSGTPSLLIVQSSVAYDIREIVTLLRSRDRPPCLLGYTSCRGVMTHEGVYMKNDVGLGMLGISDPEGGYGVGIIPIGENPGRDAARAVLDAVQQADRPGEVPSLVWLSSAPGHEEALISGIADVVGNNVSIFGGSSADNAMRGEWKQFTIDKVLDNAAVIAVLYPSTDVVTAYHCGYEPTDTKGVVTKAEKREVMEIDERPAAVLYNEWTDGIISDVLQEGGDILMKTTLYPLGRVKSHIRRIPFYVLSHPGEVTPHGGLTLYTDIKPGDELVLMHGTQDSLVSRAERVALSALKTYSLSDSDVAGALITYCAGCMLAVKERLNEVLKGIQSALPQVPFLVTFTLGEQGCFYRGDNLHGNLMISVLLFKKK